MGESPPHGHPSFHCNHVLWVVSLLLLFMVIQVQCNDSCIGGNLGRVWSLTWTWVKVAHGSQIFEPLSWCGMLLKVTLLEWHPYRHVHPLAFAFFPILLQTYHAFLVNVIEKFSIGKNEVEELDIGLHNANWKSLVLCICILHLLWKILCTKQIVLPSSVETQPISCFRHNSDMTVPELLCTTCFILGTTYTTVFGTRTACFALFNMEYLHTSCGWFSLQTEIWHQEVGCNSSNSKASCSYKTSNQIWDPMCEKPIKDTPTIGNMFMSRLPHKMCAWGGGLVANITSLNTNITIYSWKFTN